MNVLSFKEYYAFQNYALNYNEQNRNLSPKSIKLDFYWYCANLSLHLSSIGLSFLIEKAVITSLSKNKSLPPKNLMPIYLLRYIFVS